MIRKIIVLSALLFFGAFVFCQNNPKEYVETFFDTYQSKGVSAALDNLYGINVWLSRNADALSNLKSSLEGLNEEFIGKYYGYELITERHFGESYVLLSYLAKFDRQPIRFVFHFYRPDENWRLYSIKYDGDIDDEIEESAKMYRLNLDRDWIKN